MNQKQKRYFMGIKSQYKYTDLILDKPPQHQKPATNGAACPLRPTGEHEEAGRADIRPMPAGTAQASCAVNRSGSPGMAPCCVQT